MATQGGLNAEFRSERRLQLLTTLQSLLDERQPNGLPSSSWAGLWLADLERLEEIIASAGRAEFIPAITADFGVIVREKAQRERFESRSPSSSPPQSPSGLLRASPSQSSSLHRSAVEKRSGLTREPPGDEAEQPTSQPAIPPAKRQCTGSELINKDYRAWNVRTGEEIVSRREIVLTTSDPESHPLPSWDLLELQ
ncbi:hypothetical protein H113_05150 [Trichophyton rubrum MR1459]|uniref:Uncharacterized protein n=1 Tax=Trichophyton rubrum TaxID=5551 RepID=A0A178EP36_TRIRU|nr:hypothetical protein H113_05150 [Trichophyton rubrum MR1459]EZG05191.1 hypothetical protein H106_04949 [Trichophyton rubrum CBS 735.88]KMQ48093.1 hypothetical protein HL42_1210 [Trichophyton rubrum]OAL61758.1 hypothetical protein A7C99_6327 [Trichophyton rubrum]